MELNIPDIVLEPNQKRSSRDSVQQDITSNFDTRMRFQVYLQISRGLLHHREVICRSNANSGVGD